MGKKKDNNTFYFSGSKQKAEEPEEEDELPDNFIEFDAGKYITGCESKIQFLRSFKPFQISRLYNVFCLEINKNSAKIS